MPIPMLALLLAIPLAVAEPATSPANGVTFGSTGADGPLVLAPGEVRVINLAMEGTLQPTEWLVRFDYTMVEIGDGAELTFVNHPSRAPVAWIVMGDVRIGAGATIRLDGQPGLTSGGYAEPGPGGFRGGRGTIAGFLDNASAGLGPGGARGDANDNFFGGTGGSHRGVGGLGEGANSVAQAPVTGSEAIVQLAGGSGGGAGRRSFAGQALSGGGGGGGAIRIAADGLIDVSGTIEARGGAGAAALDGGAAGGGGSGGAVHLASLAGVTLGGGAQVDVSGGAAGAGTGPSAGDAPEGGAGSMGRIRIDSPGGAVTGTVPATASVGVPDTMSSLAPPRLRVLSIGGTNAPPDATLGAGLGGNDGAPDLNFPDDTPRDVIVATENIPAGSEIWLRVTRATGPATLHGPVLLSVLDGSVTFVAVPVTSGISAIQARAVLAQP